MRKARVTGRAALVMSVLILATSCVTRTEQHPPGELAWAVGGVVEDQDQAQDIADIWNRKHVGGPSVRVVALPKTADDQRQLMAIEQNAHLATFDILTLDVIWTGEFAVKRWLADLTDIRPKIERVSTPASVRSAMWNGRLWAAPLTTNVPFLYYRTDLVPRDFGANPPKTWRELSDLALRVVRNAGIPGLGGYVGQGAEYEGMVVTFLEYLWGAGSDLFNADGTEVTLDDGAARRAVAFMKESMDNGFFADGFETMTEDGALDRFLSGGAVFMRNWTHAYDRLVREIATSKVGSNFGIVALPSMNGAGTTPAVGGQNLAVSRFSRNVPAAKKFVEFASTDRDVQLYLARQSRAPTMTSLLDDPALNGNPVMKLLEQVLPSARARPSTPEWSAISADIQQEIYPAYAGQGNADDAVHEIRSFLERTLRKP